MDAVKAFNDELSGIYETKPPISRAKMTLLTKKAIKGIKFYKHIVQSMEKFVQKCRPEYKVPGLYVIDSVVRQSRHQFGPEKDVFMPRLCKNIIATFQHIYKCPPDDKPRILRVLNLWQKNSVFPQDIVQQLTVMGGAPTPDGQSDAATAVVTSMQKPAEPVGQTDQANLTNLLANLIANPDASQIQNLAGLLSSSQQNQLQELLKQVKGTEEAPSEPPAPPPAVNNSNQAASYQFNQHETNQPPFLHTKMSDVDRRQPAFNREVLDFDYSDDEQTPPAKMAKQTPGIDPSLLAKLPTRDQIEQLTNQQHMGGMPPRMDPETERMKRLEQEQEIFNKQIQQMSNEMSDRSTSAQRSDREGSRKRRRSRSKSKSRDRHHRHHKRRSHSRDHRRSRSRDRHRSRRSKSRDRGRRSRRSRSRSRDKRREKTGFPPFRDGCVSVCTTTLWIGNISAKVMQHELQAMVEEHGGVESINMIPPRGCAYVCMKERLEADKALHKIRHSRLSGKSLKCDWAPSKEMPEEQKSTWVKEHGVNYVPMPSDPERLRALSSWGCIDLDSVPEDRRDDLNPPEEISSQVENDQANQVAQPQMIPSFTPAAAGVVPNVSRMVAQPQMPMMVRPFHLNPYAVSQRMGFQQQQPPTTSTEQVPRPHVNETVKPDTAGSTTPTNDEKSDEPQAALSNVPTFQPPFGPVSVAQRFPGAMPVQLRMMPGHVGQQIMSQRMGVMPIRMGIQMQLRPGIHPGMQRFPMHGGPQMIPGQMPQHPRMRPPEPMGGFPGAIRIAMRPQPPSRPDPHQVDGRAKSGSPPAQESDRKSSISSDAGNRMDTQRDFDGPPDRKENLDHPPQRDVDRPSRDFGQPSRFDRPSRFDHGPPRNMDRPPHGMDRPPRPMHRPPHGMDHPRHPFDRPPHPMNRPPYGMNRPPFGMDRPPLGMNRPPLGMNRPPQRMDLPPQRMDRPPQRMDRPPQRMDRPPHGMDRPPHGMDRPPQRMDRPPHGMDHPPHRMDRPPHGMDRPPHGMDRPPLGIDRPPHGMGHPPAERDHQPHQMDHQAPEISKPPQGRDRPSRDIHYSSNGTPNKKDPSVNEVKAPPNEDKTLERDQLPLQEDLPSRDSGKPSQMGIQVAGDGNPSAHDKDQTLRDVQRPHGDSDRPPRDDDRPPRDMDRPPRDVDRPPRDVDRPPRDVDRPPRDVDRPPRDVDRPPRDGGRPPRDGDRPPRDGDRPPRDGDRPPRDGDRPLRDGDRPPRDGDRPLRDGDRPPRDGDRPPRDGDRPPRDGDRPPLDGDRPPRDGDRPPRDGDRPPRDGDRPPRDGGRYSRDFDRPPRDERSRDRRDFDRGRRERSRERDRRDRDRDIDRNRRGRDFDRSSRDFDRGGRDFDRRDRGPPFRRDSFRGRDDRDGRGRERGGFRGGGRGGGRFGGDSRRSPEVDAEDEEYQRKRQETLRKRHAEEDEYVAEQIDFAAFGLPSGFGGAVTGDETKDEETPGEGRRSPNAADQKNNSSTASNRKEWLEEQSRVEKSSTATTSDHSQKLEEENKTESAVPDQNNAPTSKICDSKPENSSSDPKLIESDANKSHSLENDATAMEICRSPGTPTFDEQGGQIIEEEEVYVQETDEQNQQKNSNSDEGAAIEQSNMQEDMDQNE